MVLIKRFLTLALCLLARNANAQSNNDTLGICPPRIQEIANDRATFNSTGTISFEVPGQDEWHLSMTFRDFRGGNMVGTSQYLGIFLSVPDSFVGTDEGNNTRICVYRMNGQNTRPNIEVDGANSTCTGVLSDKCQEALQGISSPGNDECAPAEDASDACGLPIILQQTSPLNFSSPRCAVNKVPGTNLPANYSTYQAGGGAIYPPDARDSFEVYDLRVQQPIPVLIKAAFPGQNDASNTFLICLAPDQITEGSRVPEIDLPDEDPNGSSQLSLSLLGILGLFVMSLALVA